MRGYARSLLKDEGGQAITEYILILSVAAFFAITLTRRILGVLDEGMLALGGQLEKDLRTGRAPPNVYVTK